MRKRKIISVLSCVCLLSIITNFGYSQNLREQIGGEGLLQVIQSDDNIFEQDERAKGVQFQREKNWQIFFDEANRAHARLDASEDNEIQKSAYLYLVPFYRALADDEFRSDFLSSHSKIQPFSADEALDVSMKLAQEGIMDLNDPLSRLKLMIEWYHSINQIRNLAASQITSLNVRLVKSDFVRTLDLVSHELVSQTKSGQAGEIANHLRALGLNYGLKVNIKKSESYDELGEMIQSINQPLVEYALGIAERSDLHYFDKMSALEKASLALLDMRIPKHIKNEPFQLEEQSLTNIVDQLWSDIQTDNLSAVQELQAKLSYVMVRYNIGDALWIGEILPPIHAQNDPKPYKKAIEEYRSIADSAARLLESGRRSHEEENAIRLILLEAQSWVSQLIQDKGLVLSSDFTWDQAKVEKDKLLDIRQSVENNPDQNSKKDIDLIQKARLHEIEFYQYQYTPASLRQSIALITNYAPEVLPSLDEVIPAPENRYNVRAGVCMLLWKGIAHDQLGEFDEAEALLTKIKDLYGDRYRYPDPWCFSIVSKCDQYLNNMPKKRADDIARGEGQ